MTGLKDKNITYPAHRCKPGSRFALLLLSGIVITCLFANGQLIAQEVKKVDKVKAFFSDETHSASKATIYSAILPGWGQAYNRKYWKIPIVYAGFAGVGYFIKTNNDSYKLYKSDYLLLKNDPNAQTVTGLDQRSLRINIDTYRRTRDLSIIGLVAWYGLVMIDANVDGHFFNYDIDEDLSMELQPWINSEVVTGHGVGISLNFKLR